MPSASSSFDFQQTQQFPTAAAATALRFLLLSWPGRGAAMKCLQCVSICQASREQGQPRQLDHANWQAGRQENPTPVPPVVAVEAVSWLLATSISMSTICWRVRLSGCLSLALSLSVATFGAEATLPLLLLLLKALCQRLSHNIN